VKTFKFFLIIIAVVVFLIVILYIFFGKTGPVASSTSKRILRQNIYILKDLDIGVDLDRCLYVVPHSFLEKNNPSFTCFTSTFFDDSSVDEAIKSVVLFLKNVGWQESGYNKYSLLKYFVKGDLLIYVVPDESYYFGGTADKYPLVVSIARMTLWKWKED
jgi:hypothetical protein